MSGYLEDDFLLSTKAGKKLYNDYAKNLSVADFYSQIPAGLIAKDVLFDSISGLWLKDDPEKQRALRLLKVPEEKITGQTGDWEKFEAWAWAVPKLTGTLLYLYSHLELRRIFGFTKLFSPKTAIEAWEQTNDQILNSHLSVFSLLKKAKVEFLVTANDLTDDLFYHRAYSELKKGPTTLLPSLALDSFLDMEKVPTVSVYIKKLREAGKVDITDFETLRLAVKNCLNSFQQNHARLGSLHWEPLSLKVLSVEEVNGWLKNTLLENSAVEGSDSLRTTLLLFLVEEWIQRDWLLQIFISNSLDIKNLKDFFELLKKKGLFPKILLAASGCLNLEFQKEALDFPLSFVTLTNSFDSLENLLNPSLFYAPWGLGNAYQGTFGTSSGFLDFSRQEVFRRLLCSDLGYKVELGVLPNDLPLLGSWIQKVCFENIKNLLI